MWFQSSGLKIFLGIGATDMRKSIDTLSILIAEKLQQDTFSGNLFAFCNRNRTILKILYWDRNGFCLWHKRLEKDKFRWPQSEEEVKEISMRELMWLIEGLDITQPQAHESIKYQNIY